MKPETTVEDTAKELRPNAPLKPPRGRRAVDDELGAPRRSAWFIRATVVLVLVAGVGHCAFMVMWRSSKRPYRRTEARMTLKQLHIGAINLKLICNVDPTLPLAAFDSGVTAKGKAELHDANRSFSSAGIIPGDTVIVILGNSPGRRTITGVFGKRVTLRGPAFTVDQKNLVYFIKRTDGRIWPEVNLPRELDPNNTGWTGKYNPHLNGRRLRYYTCKPGRISNGDCVDPWGQPYGYVLDVGKAPIIEKVISAGPDGQFGTADDIEEVITEVPLKTPPAAPPAPGT